MADSITWCLRPPLLCALCNENIALREFGSHLLRCMGTKTPGEDIGQPESSEGYRLLRVFDSEAFYQLVVAVSPRATFLHLDHLLQKTWFDAGGHCSQFRMMKQPRALVCPPSAGLLVTGPGPSPDEFITVMDTSWPEEEVKVQPRCASRGGCGAAGELILADLRSRAHGHIGCMCGASLPGAA